MTETEVWLSNQNTQIRIVQKSTSNTNIEIWIANELEKSINLNELGLHGQLYFDNYFGGFSLDPSGEKIAYIGKTHASKK